jgi:hypothetical protein
MAQPEPGTLLAFLTEVPDPGDRAGRQHLLITVLAHACALLVYGLAAEGVLSIADRWLPARSGHAASDGDEPGWITMERSAETAPFRIGRPQGEGQSCTTKAFRSPFS